jgi:adenine/guanine/hypoxanthine permease
MKLFVKGDIDGFFGLALDNLVQVLLIDALMTTVLGFPRAFVYMRVLPGVAVSLLVGNLYYAYQALQLSKKTGRNDHCALPYGINTVSLFGYVFLVMLPAKLSAEALNLPDPYLVAWKAGLVACIGSGIIELAGSFIAERIRKATPRAALLSTLSGIALGFISLGFLFRAFAHPLVGIVTLGIILLTYFGRVKFLFGLPGGLVAISVGIILSWATGIAPQQEFSSSIGLYLPLPAVKAIAEAFSGNFLVTYISIIIPMGLFNLIGSLQNIESAEAAGDSYPTAPSLAVNGIGTLAAALFGSCFPTTIYIGHPGWKALGARAGYSVLNGIFFTAICLTGTFSSIAYAVPVDAGMAIVLWIGIVISAQAFSATPREHSPAVVVGILPALAAWGALLAKTGLRAGGFGNPGNPFSEKLIGLFHRSDTWIEGAFALEQGFIFSAMIWASITVFVIERKFVKAGFVALIGALLSAAGMMHSFTFSQSDTVMNLSPDLQFVAAYLSMAFIFFSAKWLTTTEKEETF